MCKKANVKVFSNLKAMAHTISWQLRSKALHKQPVLFGKQRKGRSVQGLPTKESILKAHKFSNACKSRQGLKSHTLDFQPCEDSANSMELHLLCPRGVIAAINGCCSGQNLFCTVSHSHLGTSHMFSER